MGSKLSVLVPLLALSCSGKPEKVEGVPAWMLHGSWRESSDDVKVYEIQGARHPWSVYTGGDDFRFMVHVDMPNSWFYDQNGLEYKAFAIDFDDRFNDRAGVSYIDVELVGFDRVVRRFVVEKDFDISKYSYFLTWYGVWGGRRTRFSYNNLELLIRAGACSSNTPREDVLVALSFHNTKHGLVAKRTFTLDAASQCVWIDCAIKHTDDTQCELMRRL